MHACSLVPGKLLSDVLLELLARRHESLGFRRVANNLLCTCVVMRMWAFMRVIMCMLMCVILRIFASVIHMSLCIYIHMNIYIYIYTYIHTYIHTYTQRRIAKTIHTHYKGGQAYKWLCAKSTHVVRTTHAVYLRITKAVKHTNDYALGVRAFWEPQSYTRVYICRNTYSIHGEMYAETRTALFLWVTYTRTIYRNIIYMYTHSDIWIYTHSYLRAVDEAHAHAEVHVRCTFLLVIS
jgi:hypothetical protein